MKSSTKNDPKPLRDFAYYQQRFRNRVFSKLVSFITDQAQREQITQKEFAEMARKDPALISRLLSGPRNLTLDTISDLLLACDAEAEPPDIVLFRDRRPPNYIHPLMARTLKAAPAPGVAKAQSADSGKKVIELAGSRLKIDVKTHAGVG
jgi:transcriptional regulator with XRE-family HTH domain